MGAGDAADGAGADRDGADGAGDAADGDGVDGDAAAGAVGASVGAVGAVARGEPVMTGSKAGALRLRLGGFADRCLTFRGLVAGWRRWGSAGAGAVSDASSCHTDRSGLEAVASDRAIRREGRSSNTTPKPPMRSLIRLCNTLSSTDTPDATSTSRVPPMIAARASSGPWK
ncbi:MAG TPA: hypothetical protein VM942_07285 [Acidimicrobiales bacterium]|nr:hypothetical protein [Acidimicrobiales bacterium]